MRSRIWLSLLAIYIAWGSTYLAIHFAVKSLTPFFMTGVRFLVAGLTLYIWRRLAGDPAPSHIQWRSAAIIGSLLLVGGIGGLTWAEQFVPSGIAALIVAVIPLWVVLIEAVRRGGNRPTRMTTFGVLSGMSGILILINPFTSSDYQQGNYLFGVAVLLLAALSWAIGSVYGHRAKLPKSSLLSTGMELLIGSVGAFILGLVTGEAGRFDLSGITLGSVVGLVYLIVVGSLVGFVCYSWLLREAPITLVVTYAYINPLVAILLGNLLAQEVLTTRVLIATPLILAAVAMIQTKQSKVEPLVPQNRAIREPAGEDYAN